MKFTQTLKVDNSLANSLTELCNKPFNDFAPLDILFDEEIEFDDNHSMAIQVQTSSQPSEVPCFVKGVLFFDGDEIGSTDITNSLLGQYSINYAGNEFVVNVV